MGSYVEPPRDADERGAAIEVVRGVVARMDQSLNLARQLAVTLAEGLSSLAEALTTLDDKAGLPRAHGHSLSTAPGWSDLSRAEQDVAVLASEGYTNAEISGSLFVSVNTVKTRLSRVFDKLDVRSRRELTRLTAPPRCRHVASPRRS
ncbi:MAG: helix-turn-helix transcriptional regulator [Acidimicrobiia bacterium]